MLATVHHCSGATSCATGAALVQLEGASTLGMLSILLYDMRHSARWLNTPVHSMLGCTAAGLFTKCAA